MFDLAGVWDSISDVQKSNISFNVAGTRQTNTLKQLLTYYSEYNDLVEKARNSEGTTLSNQDKYAESLSGKLNELGTVWNNIFNKSLSSGLLKFFLDIATGISKVVETIGLLPSILSSVGAGFLVFDMVKSGAFSSIGDAVVYLIMNFEALGTTIAGAASSLLTFLATNPVGWVVAATAGILVLAKVFDALEETVEEAAEKAANSREDYQKSANDLQQLQNKESDLRTQAESLATKYNVEFTDDDTIQDIIDKLSKLKMGADDVSQLQNLQLQTRELEMQLQLQKELTAQKRGEASSDAYNVLTKESSWSDYGSGGVVNGSKTGTIVDATIARQKEYNQLYSEYVSLSEKHANAEPKKTFWGTSEYEQDERKLANLRYEMDELLPQISEGKQLMADNYSMLFDENGKVIDEYKGVVRQIEDFMNISKDASDTNRDNANSADELANSYREIAVATETSSKGVASSIKSITDVVKAQSTGRSVTLDDYNTLKDYSSALEYHNGVLQYNAEMVKELTDAKAEHELQTIASNKADAQSEYLINAREIQRLRGELEDLDATDIAHRNSILDQIDSLRAENAEIANTCTQYDLMSSAIQQATSAYQHWLNSKDASQSGEMFDESLNAWDKIKNTLTNTSSDDYGRIGNADYKAALDFVIPDTVDKTDQTAITKYMDSAKKFLTFDGNGKAKGLDIERFCKEAMDAGLMQIDASGKNYEVAGQKTMEDFANGLNLSLPFVQAMFGEMEEFGANFDWADESVKTLGDLAVKANESAEAIRSISGNEDMRMILDVSEFTSAENAISTLEGTIQEMNDYKATLDVDSDEYRQANDVIQYCMAQIAQLEAPAVMSVDTSGVQGEIGNALSLLQEFQNAVNQKNADIAMGADTSEADSKINGLVSQINGLSAEVKADLGIKDGSVEGIQSVVDGLTVEKMVQLGVDTSLIDGYTVPDYDANVVFGFDASAPEGYKPTDKKATVKYTYKAQPYNPPNLNRTVTYRVVTVGSVATNKTVPTGSGRLNGTAHANGTALAGGNWSTKKTETVLMGEVAPELVVDSKTGRWYTVGDNGAEFVRLPKGSIVFNGSQTEALLNNGKINGRGSALLNGTAMVTGGISISQAKKSTQTSSSKPSYTSTSTSASKNSSYTKSTSTTTTTNSNASKEFDKQIDFVEIALKRIEEAISRVRVVAESAYTVVEKRNNAVSDQITLLTEQIDLQSQAYKKYIAEANALGLSSDYVKKIQNGSIELKDITDEKLHEQIKEYMDLYQKAVDAQDEIAELKESINELYTSKFDNIANEYERQLGQIDHLTKTYENGIDALSEAGMIGSSEYYKYLIATEKNSIGVMQSELSDLQGQLKEAMQTGKIEIYSEAWYTMSEQINSVRENIDDATISLIKYQNAMRELDWSFFEFTNDRINSLTSEAEFLVDLLSYGNLFDDNGNISNSGLATIGLFGQKYGTFMSQADAYAEKVKELNKALEENPTDTNLLKKRDEYLKLQQEAIINAEKEKVAIKDLVSDGYKKQIESMQDLAKSYTDSLDSAKDLYDYQKKIKDKTSEVAKLQKQLNAYANDSSAESKAKVQKLQVQLSDAMEDLQETQYDQYITDQKKLLDDVLNDYENSVNSRLDDTDSLIEECVNAINSEADTIASTLRKEASSVGYSMSDAMESVWSGSGDATKVVSVYGDEITDRLTTVSLALEDIRRYTDAIASYANVEANAVSSAETSAQAGIVKDSTYVAPVAPTTSTTSSPSSPSNSSSSSTTPSANSTPYGLISAVSGTLKYGSSGTSVKALQYALNQLGYGNSGTKSLDGKFGSGTQSAVIAFQKAMGLSGDGIVGSNTKAKFKLKGYASGISNVPYAQAAWMNEYAPEMLIKPTSKSILAPLDKGDAVLNGKATKNIWDFASDPNSYIRKVYGEENLSLATHGMNLGTTIGEISVTIPIDHVDDYDDFVMQLRNDPKFEKLIQDVSIKQLSGSSKLSKYKYSWK